MHSATKYRLAHRRLHLAAKQILELLDNSAKSPFWTFFREGGSTEFLSEMEKPGPNANKKIEPDETIELSTTLKAMFSEDCQKDITKDEIIEKLRAMFLYRLGKGFEKGYESSITKFDVPPKECTRVASQALATIIIEIA